MGRSICKNRGTSANNVASIARYSRLRSVTFRFIIAFCAIACLPGLSVAQPWTSLGPTNEAGVIRNLQIHTQANRLFASAYTGGLWVTDLSSGDLNWRPISDYLDNIEIRAFAVSPSNADVIYVANKTFSLYRTSDAGANWTKLTSFDASFGRVNRIVVLGNPKTVLLATTTGLFRSTNSGSTWTSLIKVGAVDVLDIAVDPSNSSIMYAGIRRAGVLKTTDGGASWNLIKAWTDPSDTDVSVNPPMITPSQVIRISLGERRSDGRLESPTTRTVAVKFGQSIFVSRNAGGTFADRSSPLISADPAGSYRRSEDFIAGEWTNALAVDPWNSDRILVGQTNLFMTTNGGVDWMKFRATPENDFDHEDFQDIQFSRTDRDLIFVANDGGVERSTSPSPTFSKVYANLVTSQLVRVGVHGDTVVGNSDHNGVIGTTSVLEGVWRRVISSVCGYGNNGMERSDVYKDPKRPSRFYFLLNNQVGRFNFPFTDGTDCLNDASRFTPFPPYIVHPFPDKPQQPIAVDTRATSQLILVASDVIDRDDCGTLVACQPPPKTTFNLMLTRKGDVEPTGAYGPDDPRQPMWEVTAESVDDPFVSVAFSPRPTGQKNAYAITRSGALYTASISLPPPAVIKWTRQDGFVPAGAEGVRHFAVFASFEDSVVAITKNSFAKTSNAGATWTVQNNPIPSSEYYTIALDTTFIGGTDIYVGTSDGVYRKASGGTSWIKNNGALPNVKVTQLVSDSGFLYAATFGRGLWRKSVLDNIGITELTPDESTATVHQRLKIALKWTHPERWRLIDKIDLRLIDDEGLAMWVRFDEAANTFQMFNSNSGRFGQAYSPGGHHAFQTSAATMYLEGSAVQGTGPTGPSATLTYDLGFKPRAGGRTFRVEVLLADDFGHVRDFEQIGTVVVSP
jgi:photosystem II stability/assembly factor-like uncharacterized protein